MSCRSSLTCKRPTTWHGSTAYFVIRYSRPSIWFFKQIFKREMFSCACWVMITWFIWSGNGIAARCYFIYYIVYIENNKCYQM